MELASLCLLKTDDNPAIPRDSHVDWFLRQFLGNEGMEDVYKNKTVTLQFDDRARTVQSLVLPGAMPTGRAAAALPVFEARLAGVDNYDDHHLYDNDFANRETAGWAYDRFRDKGSRYFANDYNFAFLGFAGRDPYTLKIHDRDMAGSYRRMALLLHLNAAVLNGFASDVGRALEDWDCDDANTDSIDERLTRLRGHFLRFFSLNWFEDVSSQTQGIELYRLMRKHSLARRELEWLDTALDRTGVWLTARQALHEQRRADEQAALATAEARREAEVASAEGRRADRLTELATATGFFVGLAAAFMGQLGPVAPSLAKAVFGLADDDQVKSWALELAGGGTIMLVALASLGGLLSTSRGDVALPVWRRFFPVALALLLPWFWWLPLGTPTQPALLVFPVAVSASVWLACRGCWGIVTGAVVARAHSAVLIVFSFILATRFTGLLA